MLNSKKGPVVSNANRRRLALLLGLLGILAAVLWTWSRLQLPAPSHPTPVAVTPAPLPPAAATSPAAPRAAPPVPALLERQARTLRPRVGTVLLAQRVVLQRLALPDKPAATLYRELLPLAETGNPTAAYALARLLADCNKVPVDEASLDGIIDGVRRTHRYIDTAVRYPEQFAADLRRSYRRCAGLDTGQRASYHDWLVQAADNGQLDALETFELFDPVGNVCRQYVFEKCSPEEQAATRAARQVIAHYLLAARDAGSLNALWQLGGAYLDGELFPVDKVSAYANLLAYQRAAASFGLRDPVRGIVRDLRGQLGQGERAEAADQARSFLANPKCCVLIE